jgi:hypothetical protein
VTRRTGWQWLNAGTLLQPVVKGQGLKKGEKVQKLGGPIRVVSVRREPLKSITPDDVYREGFVLTRILGDYAGVDTRPFIRMFCEHNACSPDTEITRIEFEYTTPPKEDA